MTRPPTERGRAKADRHDALLREAARLFAERGFHGVSLEDIGAAVGVSGPAVYRHFAGKQALLGALLTGVSERLLDGGSAVVASTADPREQLRGLVAFHVDFALADSDVIRVQDRDLASLGDEDRRTVRKLQRAYGELWVGALAARDPDADPEDLRTRAYACFGLINSTPHSVRRRGGRPSDAAVGRLLADMALAALGVGDREVS